MKKSKDTKLNFFNFLTSINEGKRGEDLLKDCLADNSSDGASPDSPDKAYLPFMVNRGLSFFVDTILYANAMNERAHIPAKMQYDFLRNGVSPRKRFSKWAKKTEDSELISLIMRKYSMSAEKARDAASLFTTDAIKDIKNDLDKGGLTKRKKK